jgi:hypothetical protein
MVTAWGPALSVFVKLPCTAGVSPAYLPSIYTDDAGGDDQIIRDPVLREGTRTVVSVGDGDRNGVVAVVTLSIRAGMPPDVPVGKVAGSDGDEYWTQPEALMKIMIMPARIIRNMHERRESDFIDRP